MAKPIESLLLARERSLVRDTGVDETIVMISP